jgi:hypothetical protein
MIATLSRTAVLLFSLVLFSAICADASPVTLTADGEYVMGDNDTYTEGKRLALQDAKRLILEKVGTYMESTTQVKDYAVKSDEIRLYTAGIVKVDEVREDRKIIANKATVLTVTVRAVVDPDVLAKQIANMRNRKEVEERSRRYADENLRLRKEIDQLNTQLRSTVNEKKFRELRKQREEYLDKLQENERGLTVLLSEGSLFQAALEDRQKKQDDLQIVRKFLKELAAAYEITSGDPEVEDNDNGSANARIPVSVRLPGRFSVKGSTVDVPSMSAFEQTGLIIRGYPEGGLSFACSDSINTKQCRNVLKPYIDREAKAMKIVVKLGRYSATDTLAFQSVLDQSPKRYQRQTPTPRPKREYKNDFRIVERPGQRPYMIPTKTLVPSLSVSAPPSTPVHISPLSHEKQFSFDFNNLPLTVLKSINRIDIAISY